MVLEEEIERYKVLFGALEHSFDVESIYQTKEDSETWYQFLRRKYDTGAGIEVHDNYDDIASRYEDKLKMTFFCGGLYGNKPMYRKMAWDAGKFCAKNDIVVMCGGGRFGMMGTLIRSTLEHGGEVLAISAEPVWGEESDLRFVNENTGPIFDYTDKKYKGHATLIIAPELDIRQGWLVKGADAYGVLPGGKGTAYELHQILVQKSLSEHVKPIVLFNPKIEKSAGKMPYWECFFQLMTQYHDEGFARNDCLHLLRDIKKESLESADIFKALQEQIGVKQLILRPQWLDFLNKFPQKEILSSSLPNMLEMRNKTHQYQ